MDPRVGACARARSSAVMKYMYNAVTVMNESLFQDVAIISANDAMDIAAGECDQRARSSHIKDTACKDTSI